ncbi:hypothetical protein DITRI_Ditri07aG0170000 [Diplodiscus trichospermus]
MDQSPSIVPWKQRPTSPSSQATSAHDSGLVSYLASSNKNIHLQFKENFQSSELYVFLALILIVAAFSGFALTGISRVDDEKYGPGNRHLALVLDSFSIIDFRVMENRLVANWTARFIFINEENDAEISIEPFDLLVFYKGNNLVSCALLAEPLALKRNYQAVMEVEFSPEGCNKEISINEEVLQEIEEDIKKGKMSLNLRLDLRARYGEFEPSFGLELEFNSTKQSAERYSGNLPKNCQIPLPA